MKSIAALLVLSLALTANAANLVTQTPGSKSIEGVAIASSASINLNNQDITLGLIGAGMRWDQILFTRPHVYVAQLFSSDASKFVYTADGALASLNDSRTTVLTMTFLLTAPGGKVIQAYKDGLARNGLIDNNKESLADIAAKDAAVGAFMNDASASGDAVKGATMTIAIEKNADGTETLTYQDTSGKTYDAITGQDLTRKIMAIWLGVTGDDKGLGELKTSILKGNN